MRQNFQQKHTCEICAKSFLAKRSRKNVRFCSRSCWNMGMKGHRAYHWKGGRLVHKGYVYILQKDHPKSDRDGYVSEHRLVMEKHLGRYLVDREMVHHKNADRADNRIKNLELVESQSEHMKQHYPKGKHIYRGGHPWFGKRHSLKSKAKMKLTRSKNLSAR